MPHSDHILTNSNPFVSKRRNVTLWEQIYVLTNNNKKNNDKLCITGRLCFFALTQPTLDGGVADEHILFELLRFNFAVSPLADSFSLGMRTAAPPTTAADKTPTLQSRPLNSVDHNLIKYLLQYHHRTAPEAERSCLDRSELLW